MKILAKKSEQYKIPEKKTGGFGKSRYDWHKIFTCGQQVLLEHGTEEEVEVKTKDFSGKVQNLAFNAVLQGKKMGYNVATLITEEGDLVLQARPATEEEKAGFAKLFESHKETAEQSKQAKKHGLTLAEYREVSSQAEEAGLSVQEYLASVQSAPQS